MLVECAVITAVEPGKVTLKSSRSSACVKCAQGKGCGGGIIAQLVPSKSIELTLTNRQALFVGQNVELALPVASILSLSALIYIGALLSVLLGALAGSLIFDATPAVVLSTVASFVMWILLSRAWMPRLQEKWIIERIRLSQISR